METLTINLFYPILFLTIIVLIVTIGTVLIKCKDSNLFQNIFYKSSDNAKEITEKVTTDMKDMHDNVIKVDFTDKHEQELDIIERNLEELQKNVFELKETVDELIKRVILIESNQK